MQRFSTAFHFLYISAGATSPLECIYIHIFCKSRQRGDFSTRHQILRPLISKIAEDFFLSHFPAISSKQIVLLVFHRAAVSVIITIESSKRFRKLALKDLLQRFQSKTASLQIIDVFVYYIRFIVLFYRIDIPKAISTATHIFLLALK